MPGQEARGYDLGNYMPAGMGHEPGDPMQQQADWSLAAHGYDPALDPAYQSQLGYDGQGGALEQPYPEEHVEYDTTEPRRGSWALRIAGAIVVAVALGYGLAQGYKMMMGPSADGVTPVVKGDDAPTKTKPSDPGGKQFAHTDSKVMGRLGEPGADPSSAPSSAAAEPPAAPASGAPEADASGARKVTTVMVGRDGSIVPPESPAEPSGNAGAVAVPGLTMVDGYAGQYPGAGAQPTTPPKDQAAAAHRPVVVNPPAAEQPAVVTAAAPPSASPSYMGTEPATAASPSPPPAASASTSETGALPAPKHPKVKKVAVAAAVPPAGEAAATGEAAAAPSAGGANGYVVVLASVPASGQSRLVALKKFADMQQQYGTVLQNKTPDVREANLGQKGIYHRLLVGPPGSRAQASTLCTELKTAGYKDCWVTAY